MMGIGTPKIDGSVKPKLWLVHHDHNKKSIKNKILGEKRQYSSDSSDTVAKVDVYVQ